MKSHNKINKMYCGNLLLMQITIVFICIKTASVILKETGFASAYKTTFSFFLINLKISPSSQSMEKLRLSLTVILSFQLQLFILIN